MDGPIPEELKYINQFIQRSKELKTQEPIISYYCLCYSVKLAISQGFKSQESRDYISSLFDLLEETKKTQSDNEAVTSELAGIAYVENFALKVFQSADNQERSGNLSIKTVRAFMAAANFLEILKYFDKELEGEILEKLKYSKFKAAEIAKLIKEGKVNREDGQRSPISQGDASENANVDSDPSKQQNIQPSGQDNHPIDRLPSPPTVNHNINDISSFPPIPPTFQSDPNDFNILPTPPTNPILPTNNSDTIDLPSIPQHNPSSAPQSPFHQPPSAPQSPYNQVPAPPPPSHASPVNHSPYNMSSMYDSLPASQPPKMLDPKLLSQAEKCCRFAISSLQYDDLEEALKQLDKARNLIVQLQQQK